MRVEEQNNAEPRKAGYRHIDCTTCFGNEAECGVAFAAAFRDGGISARDEVFITGKLWNSEHAPEHVGLAMEQTLLDLSARVPRSLPRALAAGLSAHRRVYALVPARF